MNPTDKELYQLVLADAPYVIAAYAVLWAALIVYMSMILRRIMRLEKQIGVVEESVAKRAGAQGE
jgi:CcmD family protein